MARPRRRTRPSVSLFPFLSVLACVMGTLILLITASATSQIAAGGVDIERYEHLEQEIAESRRQLATLRDLEREVADVQGQLEKARARAEALEAERESAGDVLARTRPLRASLDEAEQQVTALEAKLAPLQRQGAAKRGELAERRRQLANAPIRIRSAGSGTGLTPQFVECRSDGIVMYESPDWQARPLPLHLVPRSGEYLRFLQRVGFDRGRSVVFLVRPGGIDAYREADAVARRQGLRRGAMPITRAGEIDFSVVDEG